MLLLLLSMLLCSGSLLDEVVKTGELELPLLPRVHAGVEVEVAPLGIEELAVPGERALVRGPALDHGQRGGLVVEAEVPPPVVDILQPMIGAARVHGDLAEHAESPASVRLPLSPNSDAAAPGEAEVLVALGVPVPDDGLLRVLDQGRGAARVAGARAHLHSKLGFHVCRVEACGLH